MSWREEGKPHSQWYINVHLVINRNGLHYMYMNICMNVELDNIVRQQIAKLNHCKWSTERVLLERGGHRVKSEFRFSGQPVTQKLVAEFP